MANEVPTAEEERAQRARLAKRVIRGDVALSCCEGAERRYAQDILRIINEVGLFILNAKEGEDLALVPMTAPAVGLTTRLVVGTGGAAVLGAVVLASGAEVISMAQQTGALYAVELISNAIGQSTARRRSTCETCIRKSVLSQGHPRETQRTKIRRRL